jgi:hypothetical protein
VAVLGDEVAENLTLQQVAGGGAPVQAVVVPRGEVGRLTPEEAAPIMAETPSLCSFGTVVSNALLSASPESPKVTSTVTPAAASLTSLRASWTPASSGGPRKARLPV